MNRKLTEREKWLIYLTALMLMVYFLYNFIFLPMFNQVNGLQKSIVKKEIELRTMNEKLRLLENSNLSPINKLRAKGKEERIVEAIHYLSSEISKLKLDLKTIASRGDETNALGVKTSVIDMKIEGSYNSIYKFIYAIERLPILIAPSNLFMVKVPDSSNISALMSVKVYY
jgi:Tfp pilus assembly protein PilO